MVVGCNPEEAGPIKAVRQPDIAWLPSQGMSAELFRLARTTMSVTVAKKRQDRGVSKHVTKTTADRWADVSWLGSERTLDVQHELRHKGKEWINPYTPLADDICHLPGPRRRYSSTASDVF